ncbi:MAG: M23 family metallopeptidase [Kastovskya adunca ATA6-11-RM4]|jgi:hypothetical protein|nr:M23 family metallopeptidase [Kastovskya adunca ATA6-11-RM4]
MPRRITSEEIIEQLRRDYPNGFPSEKTLEEAISAIARHHAQEEVGSLKGFIAVVLLIVLAFKLRLPVPAPPQLLPKLMTSETGSSLAKTTSFEALKVATPFLIDNSPPGSWDFTLSRNGSTSVEIPSPCTGVVNRVWFQGVSGNLTTGRGAGQIVQVACEGKDYGWLIAHMEKPLVREGDQVLKGHAMGIQGSTGRSNGDHVHAQIHKIQGDNWGARITDRAHTAPLIENYFAFVRKGQ